MALDTAVQFVAILVVILTLFFVFLFFAAGVGVVVRLAVDKSIVPDYIAIGKGLRRLFGGKKQVVEEKV